MVLALEPWSTVLPITVTIGFAYVAEDGATPYTTEDGSQDYIPETGTMSLKLSQIALAPAPPALTDVAVGVGSGSIDYQYTWGQIATTVGASMANKKYVSVPASQTNFLLGSTGAIGDYLANLLIVPVSTSPGLISISDGAGAPIVIFEGGAEAVNDLTPFTINIGLPSTSGGWHVTTGTSVSVLAAGNFT
jgi:hypothetical protein